MVFLVEDKQKEEVISKRDGVKREKWEREWNMEGISQEDSWPWNLVE